MYKSLKRKLPIAILICAIGLMGVGWWMLNRNESTYWSPDGNVCVRISDDEFGGHRNVCRLISGPWWQRLLYPRLLASTVGGSFTRAVWTSNDRVVIEGKGLEHSLTSRPIKREDLRYAGVEVVWINR